MATERCAFQREVGVYIGDALEPHVLHMDWIKYHDALVHLTIMRDGLTLVDTTVLGQSGMHPRCSKWGESGRYRGGMDRKDCGASGRRGGARGVRFWIEISKNLVYYCRRDRDCAWTAFTDLLAKVCESDPQITEDQLNQFLRIL